MVDRLVGALWEIAIGVIVGNHDVDLGASLQRPLTADMSAASRVASTTHPCSHCGTRLSLRGSCQTTKMVEKSEPHALGKQALLVVVVTPHGNADRV